MGHGLVRGLALVVADGGREVGLGHIARSSALAVALRELGLSVRCLALQAAEPLELDGVRWLPLAGLRGAALDDAAVLVLDSYRAAEEDIAAIPAAVPLVVLHEHVPPPRRAALVVSAGSDPDPSDPRRLGGLEYASLRTAFWAAPPATVSERVERVLVTTGGGDPVPGLGARLAAVAREALPAADVVLVRGPFGSGGAPTGVKLLDAPESLYDALADADVVVTAGGQTLLEAAAVGVPSIAVVAVENQRPQATRLAQRGAVILLELPANELPSVLRELDRAPGTRRELAREAQAAVDGQGARRVAASIAALV